MHGAVRHGAPSLTYLPKGGEASFEVRPSRSTIWSLAPLDQAYFQSPDEVCISHRATHLTQPLKFCFFYFHSDQAEARRAKVKAARQRREERQAQKRTELLSAYAAEEEQQASK